MRQGVRLPVLSPPTMNELRMRRVFDPRGTVIATVGSVLR